MAQGTLTVFEEFALFIGDGSHDLNSDSFKTALITTLPVDTQTTPDFADFTEVTGDNYTAGGEALTTTYVEAAGVATFDSSANPAWVQAAGGPTNIKAALIYNTTHAGTNDAVAFIDMTTDGGTTAISLADGDISITFNGSGILTVTVT